MRFAIFTANNNSLELILIFFYLILFSVVIFKTGFFKVPGINRITLTAIFILKVVFSIFYGVMHLTYYGNVDTFQYFHDGNVIFSTIEEEPADYFRLVFGPNKTEYPQRLQDEITEMGFWDNTGSYLVVRFNAIFRIFSGGSYIVHAIFMAFLSLIGLLLIYKLFSKYYPEKRRFFAIFIFLMPSVLFYGSGLHKEGLSILFIGLLLYNFDLWVHNHRRWGPFLIFTISSILLFLVKEFYMATLFPCLVAYYWYHIRPKRLVLKYVSSILVFWLILFNLYWLLPSFNLSVLIADKQSQFLSHKGESDIELESLKPEVGEIIARAPDAVINTIIRPFPNEIKTVYQLFYLMEVFLVVILILIAIFLFKRGSTKEKPIAFLAISFAITTFIIIGLIVPNLGAISRYKSPALIFLLCFLVIIADTDRFKSFFRR